jgi:hypothetical protein
MATATKRERIAPRFWFWPGYVAGKRETSRLREEHNDAVNAFLELEAERDTLLTALRSIAAREPKHFKLCPAFALATLKLIEKA